MRQYIRAAVLGSNDGLVSISSLMVGASAAHLNIFPIAVAGIAAGAASMAVGEDVSVRAEGTVKESTQAAISSAISYTVGGVFPFLGGYFGDVGTISSTLVGLLVAGILSARSTDKPVVKSTFRVMLGGILGMVITATIGSLV